MSGGKRAARRATGGAPGRDDTSAEPRLRVAPSSVHGMGAFAARALPRGTFLGFYEGRRYPAAEAATRDWSAQLGYLAMLSNGDVIDGADGGNATRFLNHSCAPNCEAFETVDAAGRPAFRFQTLRAVMAGEELFVDYELAADDGTTGADHPCHCGAPTCRGTLLAPI